MYSNIYVYDLDRIQRTVLNMVRIPSKFDVECHYTEPSLGLDIHHIRFLHTFEVRIKKNLKTLTLLHRAMKSPSRNNT